MKKIGTQSINMSDIMILWPCLVQLFIKSYVLGGLKDDYFLIFELFPTETWDPVQSFPAFSLESFP